MLRMYNLSTVLFFYTYLLFVSGCWRDKDAEGMYRQVLPNKKVFTEDELWPRYGVYGAFYSPDGQSISAGCGTGEIMVYDRKTLMQRCCFTFHQGPVHSTLFSSDSRLLISSSYDSTVAVFDVESCRFLKQNIIPNRGTYMAIFSNDVRWYSTCGADSCAYVFSYSSDSLCYIFKHPDVVHFVWFSDDDRYLATACEDGMVRLFDFQSKGATDVKVLRGHLGPVYCVVIDHKNEWVVTVGQDKTVRLWDLNSGSVLRIMQGHKKTTFAALFSPDRSLIGSCSADQTIRLWDTNSGRLVLTLRGHEGIVSSLHFSPDGTELLSASMDGTIRLWDVKTGLCRQVKRVGNL